jgi:hypothetical protein
MSNEARFRIKEMLEEERRNYPTNRALANAINAANPPCEDDNGNTVSCDKLEYRKLARILDRGSDADFVFSISELRALDRFFSLRDKSLCDVPIFYRTKNLLEYFFENKKIAFMMATRYQALARTETISRWDLRAMQLLFKKGSFENIKTEIYDVFHHASNFGEIEQEEWVGVFDKRRTSVVSLGSPFACHASERLLADVFAVEAFQSPDTGCGNRLPMYFYWSNQGERQGVAGSALLLDQKGIRVLFGNKSGIAKKVKGVDRAIIVGDRCFVSQQTGRSYGLLIAQRRNPGCIYAAIIGAYGPDTLAVARCLADGNITGELPLFDGRVANQPVFITVVETHIKHRLRDMEKVTSKRETRISHPKPVIVESALWECADDGQWHPRTGTG